MSLRLRGDLGKWRATTGNSSLGISQSLLTVNFFIRLDTPSAVTTSVMGMVAGPLSNAFVVVLTASTLSVTLRGVSGTLAIGIALATGKSTMITLRLDGAGTSTISSDGAIKASKAGLGTTTGGTNQIYIGTNAASPSANFLFDKAAIWNGASISDALMLRLRDGLDTPATLSTPATSYWLFNGTPSTNPTAADGAMHDLIGPSDFITIPGAGGGSTFAVYDATNLIYVAPIATAPYVCRHGMLAFPVQTNPALGTPAPSLITAIAGTPTVHQNGTLVSLFGPFWPDGTKRMPIAFYWPYNAASPQTPITISGGDTWTWSAPDNWISSSLGSAAADSGTMSNYYGLYEPGLWGYLPFDPALINKTFLPAYGGGDLTSTSNPPLNVLHRCANPWSGALTSTADGYPLTVSAGGNCSSLTWGNSLTNWISNTSFPIPFGTWTLQGDEHLPATPIVATLTANAAAAAAGLLTGPVIIPGTITGGVEVGKQWVWTVAQGTPDAFVNSLTLKFTAPATMTAITLKNAILAQPNDTPPATLTATNDISQNFLSTLSDGVVAMPYVRYLQGAYPNSSWVDPADIPAAGRFSQRGPGPRTLTITAVQFYDATAFPNVYSQTKWSTTPILTRFVASDNAIADWMIRLADWGLTNSWPYATTGTTNQVVCQFKCVGHGLKTAQFVQMGTFTAPCSNPNGSGICHIGGTGVISVTDPDHFLMTFGSTLTQASVPGQITGVNVVSTTASSTINNGNPSMTVEQVGNSCQAVGNPGVWITLNHALSDAAVTSYGTRLFNSTTRGTKILVQISNEPFINNFNASAWQMISTLVGYGTSNTEPTIMQRLYEMVTIFKGIWGADSDSVILLIQPWTVLPQNTNRMLTYAQTWHILVNKIAIAPYVDLDFSPTFQTLCASVIADNPDSIANIANGGLGVVVPMGAKVDSDRHWVKYNSLWNGANTFIAGHIAQIAATGYGGGSGGFTAPAPQMILYEGGLSNFMIAGVSHTKKVCRTGLSHDEMYGPWYYLLETTWLAACQQPGPTGTQGFESGCLTSNITPRSFAGSNSYVCTDGVDNNSCELWANGGVWQGQEAGDGSDATYWSTTSQFGGNAKSNDIINKIPARKAIFDWLTGFVPPVDPVYFVSPLSVPENQAMPQLLTLTGSNTTWTSGSTVSVTNSLSGTTTVAKGTWTALSSISATLTVTTGAGAGTWKITVDGVDSPTLTVTGVIPPVLPSKGRAWIGALSRPRK